MPTPGEDLTAMSPQPPRCESLSSAKPGDRIACNNEIPSSYGTSDTQSERQFHSHADSAKMIMDHQQCSKSWDNKEEDELVFENSTTNGTTRVNKSTGIHPRYGPRGAATIPSTIELSPYPATYPQTRPFGTVGCPLRVDVRPGISQHRFI